jgi:hypothetical protein
MLQVLFITSVAFAFTASADSKRVPFNAGLIFGNKKSHAGLGQVRRVDIPTRDLVLHQKHLDRQCIVCRHNVKVKNP